MTDSFGPACKIVVGARSLRSSSARSEGNGLARLAPNEGRARVHDGWGRVLPAIDSKTGQTVGEFDLGQIAYANPVTYRTREGEGVVVIATGAGATSKLVGFGVP